MKTPDDARAMLTLVKMRADSDRSNPANAAPASKVPLDAAAPRADSRSDCSNCPASTDSSSVPVDFTARLEAFEAATQILIGRQADDRSESQLQSAVTDVSRLSGDSQADWLPRLGMLAARGDHFLLARDLASASGSQQRALEIYAAIARAWTARRHPSLANVIAVDEPLSRTVGVAAK
jgi:hypothetical protein